MLLSGVAVNASDHLGVAACGVFDGACECCKARVLIADLGLVDVVDPVPCMTEEDCPASAHVLRFVSVRRGPVEEPRFVWFCVGFFRSRTVCVRSKTHQRMLASASAPAARK